jgi:hypothetical protein
MNTDLTDWLAELVHQQRQRDPRITERELYASFDRYFDALNSARAQGGSMVTHPAGEPLHIPLKTGEVVTITTAADQVVLALYSVPDKTGSSGDDDTVEPAPVIALTADECEVLGSMLTYAAVAVYGQRSRLRPVTSEDNEDGEPPTSRPSSPRSPSPH